MESSLRISRSGSVHIDVGRGGSTFQEIRAPDLSTIYKPQGHSLNNTAHMTKSTYADIDRSFLNSYTGDVPRSFGVSRDPAFHASVRPETSTVSKAEDLIAAARAKIRQRVLLSDPAVPVHYTEAANTLAQSTYSTPGNTRMRHTHSDAPAQAEAQSLNDSVHSFRSVDADSEFIPRKIAQQQPALESAVHEDTTENNHVQLRVNTSSAAISQQLASHTHVQSLLKELRSANEEVVSLKQRLLKQSKENEELRRLVEERAYQESSRIKELEQELRTLKTTSQEEHDMYEDTLQRLESQLESYIEEQRALKQQQDNEYKLQMHAMQQQHSSTLQEYSIKLQESMVACATMESEVSKLRELQTALEDELQGERLACKAAQEQLKKVEAQLEAATQSQNNLSAANATSSTHQTAAHLAEMDGLKTALTKAHHTAMEEMRKHYTQQLDVVKTQAESDLADFQARIRRLQNENFDLLRDRVALTDEQTRLQQEIRRVSESAAESEAHKEADRQRWYAAGFQAACDQQAAHHKESDAVYESTIQQLKEQLNTLDEGRSAVLQEVRDKLHTAEVQVRELQRGIETHQWKIEELQQTITNKENALADAAKEKQRLKEQVQEHQRRCNDSMNRIAELEVKLQTVSVELSEAIDKCATVVMTSEERETAVQTLRQQLNAKEERITALQEEAESLRHVQDELHSRIGKLTAEKQAEQQNVQTTKQLCEKDLNAAKETIRKHVLELETMTQERKQLQSTLDQERLRTADFQHRLERCQEETQQAKTVAELLREELSIVAAKQAPLEAHVQRAEAEMQHLRIQIRAATSVHSAERELSEQLAVAIADNEAKNDVIAALERELNSLQQLAIEQGSLLESTALSVQQLQSNVAENAAWKSRVEELRNMLQDKDSRLADAERCLNDVSSTLERLKLEWMAKERGYFETIRYLQTKTGEHDGIQQQTTAT